MLEIEATPLPPSRSPKWRWIAAMLAVAMVAGAAGVVIGRAVAPDPDPRAVGAAPTSLPPTSPAAESPGAASPGAETATTDAPESIDMAAGDVASTRPSSGSGQYSTSAYPEQARPLLAERTVAVPGGDAVVRAHFTPYGDEMVYDPWGGAFPGWAPAPWCSPSGDLRVSVSTPTSVNVNWAPWYDEPMNGLSVNTFATGYVEGAPMFGAVVQVGPDVIGVSFTTTAGSDHTAPQSGVALLLVPGEIDDAFSVDLERGDGSSTSTGAAELVEAWSGPTFREGCEPPPPALPEPGEQPTDRDAAEQRVHDAWATVHGGRDGLTHAERATAVDDATGLDEAWTALEGGEYAEAAATSTSTVRELVFTSPTEAWFRYDIDTSIADFSNRYGIARQGDDGVWRITRDTVCQDLALAPGFGCTPTVAQVLPPSAATDPRYSTVPSEGEIVAG